MKKYIFSLMGCIFSIINSNAQVPNASFEEFSGYGNETRFWGANPTLIPITIDLNTGNSISDTVIYDEGTGSSCFYNNEAHSGNRAMEIRNAFNLTKNEVIPGKMILFNENEGSMTASGWNTGFDVSEGTVLNMLGFYYKFYPLGNDVAKATIEVLGESGIIGTGFIQITQATTTSDFDYVYVPINFTSTETPVFMHVSFSMAAEGSTPTFGSRLVIDDVVTNTTALNVSILDANVSIYPTLVENELNIDTKGLLQDNLVYKIINTEGKIVKQNNATQSTDYVYTMDVSGLTSGVYFLNIANKSKNITKKFIKK